MASCRLLAALSFGLAALSACSIHDAPPESAPTLTLDHATFMLLLPVDPNGIVRFPSQSSLMGSIDASPILQAEGRSPRAIQVILHLGFYYLTADGFANVWELRPQQGSRLAAYRPIRLPETAASGIRLSRYGPAGQACLRVDSAGKAPLFLGAAGALSAHCP